ncbi:hypothetical protein [Rhodoferax sp.]|uniref:hypothetical protein n=1 Tax=Rhodoferax sp. TaxID=50421 RepID=UPI0019E4CCBB|nr:hypothetical protein [Rhodoferax sp.]MBE0473662.1 hypothetical protein [Rhodoferax sp.]
MNSSVVAQMAVMTQLPVIANAVMQSMTPEVMDRHASLAMTTVFHRLKWLHCHDWSSVGQSIHPVREISGGFNYAVAAVAA